MIPEKVFYVHPDYVRSESFVLDKIESNHVSNVFRLIPGDSILLINGLGIGYIGKIKVIEVPIKYTFNKDTSVSLIKDPIVMLRDLFKLRKMYK